MPAAIAIPALATVIAGSATAAAGIYGSRQQSNASKRAAQRESESLDKSLAWEQEQDARNRQAYAQAEEENKRRWGIEADRDENRYVLDRGDSLRNEQRTVDTYNMEQRRRQPYRDTSIAAMNTLAAGLGLNVRTSAAPQVASNVPANVSPQTMAILLERAQAQGQPVNTTRSA
jgi:hypothetical protein